MSITSAIRPEMCISLTRISLIANSQIRVSNVVDRHVGLKQFAHSHPWFPSLVAGMLSNWLRDPKIIQTNLATLSSKEALKMGQSFSVALKSRKVAEAGVDVWLNEYAALVQISKENAFFVPMAVTIGQRKLDQAPWGLVWKVGFGAFLGILDLVTDVNAIYSFYVEGNHGFAKAVIAMISASMAVQLLLVYGNGKKRGNIFVLKEVLIVLSGLKPAVDAYRVVSGVKVGVEAAMDPMLELVLAKVIET